jgi:uncharacterized protein
MFHGPEKMKLPFPCLNSNCFSSQSLCCSYIPLFNLPIPESMESSFIPTQQSERINVLDFLRGIAVLGILIINIESFCYPDPWSPSQYGFHAPTDHTTRFWVYFLAQGKFFSMFTLLFGVGFYVFLERLEKKGLGLKAMDIFGRRLLWLFIFGVIHAYLIWDGDVLFHYAICGFLLFPFRSFSVKQLLLILMVPVSVILYNAYESTAVNKRQYEAYVQAIAVQPAQRTEQDEEAISTWEKKTKVQDASTQRGKLVRKTLFENWIANAENIKVHKGNILHTGILFRTLIMMILGIVLYKLNVFREYKAVKYYWPMTIGILLVALVVNYLRYYHWTFEYFDPVKNVWQGWMFAFPKEVLGLAYILLFNGLYQKYFAKLSFKLISPCGKMALTNYILQSCICAFLFYGFGLGLFNQFSRSELLLVVVGIWLFQIALSFVWMQRYRYGPLEWCWRKLTYGAFK